MPSGYYRYPTIHGDTIIFVCEDDLWAVPAVGGVARRLTANLSEVSYPALSPDGQWLAFTSQEEGEQEIYCMPAMGGAATRLTYLGARTRVVGWHPDGESIIFSSNTLQPFTDLYYLYRVPYTSGGQPELLPTGAAVSVSFGGNGGMVIGRNTSDLARWKRYRGGSTGNLWIDIAGDGHWQRLTDLDGNVAQPLWVGDHIYFVSDHEGIGNLYSCLPTGEDLRRHTHHEDYYIRHPATNGQRIVYHAGADLYLYDPGSETPERVAVEFHSPRVQRNNKFVDAENYLQDYNLHPVGHSMAVIARGKPYVMALWEKAVIQQGQLHGVRYRLATWLQDGLRLAMVSDETGEEALEIHYVDASASPDRLEGLDIGRVEAMRASPIDSKLALANHRQELLVVDLEAKTDRVLDSSRYRAIRGFCWSPDGCWLAYSYWNTHQTAIIKLCLVETGETWEVTRPLLRDVSPSFDPDGKYLYFLSYREFDPIYDNLHFDLSFPWGMRPYLITLQADLPSPFQPVPRPPGEKIPQPDRDSDDSPERDADDLPPSGNSGPDATATEEKPKNNEPKPIQIDLAGIQDRLIAFPVTEKRYHQILGIKGKALFSSFPVTSARGSWQPNSVPAAYGRLEAYDFENQEHETLLRSITNFDVSLDNQTLVYRAGNDLRVLKAGERPDDAGGHPSRKTGWLDLGRIKVLVDPPSEWEQMFREAWRLQRDYFWNDDMSAIDWEAVYKRYLPLVERVATRAEFSDLLWEMQGELGTSHAYEYGGDYRPEPTYYQGFLGANFAYDTATHSYRLEDIVQGDVWDERASSPLAQPGLNIRPGDRLVALNRRKIGATLSPQALLVNQAGEEVMLTLVRDGDPETAQTVSVKTLYSERAARYRQWVEQNRQRVHAATDGRVGYVHIPDMGAEGFAEFHRGYLAEVVREGLIIDVRFNGGGFVSSLLLEKLARQRIGYDVSRWREPDPYPQESSLGLIVAIANEHAGSDGDIFCHAFKLLKLGPLIGTRTWGGVIGVTVNEVLADGALTTQPQFSTWFHDVGWKLENYGTDPDIPVEIRPQDYLAGEDVQLTRAIEEISQRLSTTPAEPPDFGSRPSLSLPTLPRP